MGVNCHEPLRLRGAKGSLGARGTLLGLPGGVDGAQLGSAEASHAALLVLAQPGLLGVAEDAAGEEVDDEADDDGDKGNGVQEVDGVAKDVDADDDAPEVGRQEGDVEEGGAAHAQDERGEGVEDEEEQGVADEPAGDGAVPVGVLEGFAVKDGGLDAVDDHAEEAQEGEDVVHGPLGDEPLLEDVGDAVQGGAEEAKEIALDHVDAGAAVGAGDVVGGEEDAHAAAADEDADDLEGLVAHAQQGEGDDDDADDGPEVEQLGGQEVGVAVGQDGEVVALDVEEGHDEVAPAVLDHDTPPDAGAVPPDGDGGVDEEEQDVVEDGLEGGDVRAGVGEERGEGVGAGDAERQDLADGDDGPEVYGAEGEAEGSTLVRQGD
ncbi:hypothetical protein Trco_007862 [Trichoderma cornu-damae]|uniref:Uncharacterized protein n=1 Tax=Trichoderma cornu-damae TaxID=654480 RepID=A0A9P8TRQ2_9HYPO|nr:hypothetical protein Trco_007862 [Trichoderma cornu-damae]